MNDLDQPPDTLNEDGRAAEHLALAAMRFDEDGYEDEADIERTLEPYRRGRRDPFELIRALADSFVVNAGTSRSTFCSSVLSSLPRPKFQLRTHRALSCKRTSLLRGSDRLGLIAL